jgi:hypothetical protein
MPTTSRQLTHGIVVAFLSAAIIAARPAAAQDSTSANAAGSQTVEDRSVSLKELPGNTLADQKDIWLFPVKLVHAEHWCPTIAIVGVTGALVATDAHSAPPFRTTNAFSGFNQGFSGSNAAAIVVAVPAAIYGVGWLRKDNYDKDSGLLAGEAVADSFLLNISFKAITARRQPLSYYGNGPYTDSFFNGSHNPFHSGGIFLRSRNGRNRRGCGSGAPIPATPLGSVRGLRLRGSDQFFPHHHK